MIVAVAILFMVTTLASAGVIAASHGSSATIHDIDRKLALAAADGAIDVAMYRLDNTPGVTSSNCVTNLTGPATPVGYQCIDGPESIGNGTTLSFVTTTQGAYGAYCLGQSLPAAGRCITAEGTFDGIGRSVQVLVAAGTGATYFPVAGILGTSGISINASENIQNIQIASNGEVVVGASDNLSIGDSILLGGGSGACANNGTKTPGINQGASENPSNLCTLASNSSTYTLPPVSATAAYASNNDVIGASGISGTVNSQPIAAGSAGCNACYDPTNHFLNLNANVPNVNFAAGTYYFCKIYLGSNPNVTVSGGPVKIYLDAPGTGNGCATGNSAENGTMYIQFGGCGSSPGCVNNTTPLTPTNLTVYVVGNNNGQNTSCTNISSPPCDVYLGASGKFIGGIVAPQSSIYLGSSSQITGAISGNYVIVNASDLITWNAGESSIVGGSGGAPSRSGWHECPDMTWPPTLGYGGC